MGAICGGQHIHQRLSQRAGRRQHQEAIQRDDLASLRSFPPIQLRLPAGERQLWELAAQNLPPGRVGDYNQALMDFGATLCLPRNPLCLLCPVTHLCQARQRGVQEQRPVELPRPQAPHIIVTAAVIRRFACVLIAQRPLDGLLGGCGSSRGGKCKLEKTCPLA